VRLVADTNILISAFLWGGKPAAILQAARTKRITLFTSPALLVELEETLARRKFVRRLREVQTTPELLTEG
jgi:putative PIN family toxin of toxin-antitoxin system